MKKTQKLMSFALAGILAFSAVNVNYVYADTAYNAEADERFDYVFPFSEGMAAVVVNEPNDNGSFNPKVGYINEKGELIIPAIYGQYFRHGTDYTGFFKDGVVTVFRNYTAESISYDERGNVVSYTPGTIEIAVLDKNGKIVEDFKTIYDFQLNENVILTGSADNYFVYKDPSLVIEPPYGFKIPETQITETKTTTTTATASNKPSSWAQNEVKAAEKAGLYDSADFKSYTAPITRSQFAEIVVNMTETTFGENAHIAPVDDDFYNDTTNEDVLKATMIGVVNGVYNESTSNYSFKPNNSVTREELATMLYRGIQYIEENTGEEYTEKNTDLHTYSDAKNVSSWAKESVGVLANNDIMKGTSETTLSPKGTVTVEQAIVLTYRIFEQMN